MKVNALIAIGATLVSSVSAFGKHQLLKQADVSATTAVRPSQDPWYKPPFGYQALLPGTILKIRSAPNSTLSTIANAGAAYNILYRTTNSKYLPAYAVTTLFVPAVNPDSTKLLSYQIPYDTAYIDGSPSYTFNSQAEPDISTALGKGWYVTSADYEGPLASFTAGVTSGFGTLDSVRAVLAAGKGINLFKTKYAMWGYSGGALASEWAAELQGLYAPELNFVGTALGGLTPNVTSVLYTCDGTVYAGLIPSGILGLASQYSELQKFLNSTLKTEGPYNITGFYRAKTLDLYGSIGTYAGQRIENYFTTGLDALSSKQAQYVINRDGIMGTHGRPKMPLFVYKAIGDDISVVADTDDLVAQYCAAKPTPSINYDRNTVGNHLTEENNGVARSFAFLTSVLGGTYNVQGCHIQNVTVNA